MRYLVTGGGTGGHIYPALAVIKELEADDGAEVLYVGSRTGLEAQIVPREGVRCAWIDAAGIMGKSVGKAVLGATQAAKGFAQAMRIVREFKPQAAVGTGGYVSGPVLLAAAMRRTPVAVMEQNAVPGFTNRALSRFAAEVYVPFENMSSSFYRAERCFLTGNPVRTAIMDAEREQSALGLGLNPEKKTLFIFGGSRGARRIVEVALDIITRRLLCPTTQVLFVTGRDYEVMAKERLASAGVRIGAESGLVLRSYLYSIEAGFASADLLVGRAGGMTISETFARGLPSILVPSPNVANNHQMHNARAAEKTGGALCVPENRLNPDELAAMVNRILNDDAEISKMAENAKAAGKPNATSDIAVRLKRLALARES